MTASLLAVLAASLSCACSMLVVPQLQQLRQVNATLCGGNRSFVYSVDGANAWVYAAPSNPWNVNLDFWLEEGITLQAIHRIIWGQGDNEQEMHIPARTPSALREVPSWHTFQQSADGLQ